MCLYVGVLCLNGYAKGVSVGLGGSAELLGIVPILAPRWSSAAGNYPYEQRCALFCGRSGRARSAWLYLLVIRYRFVYCCRTASGTILGVAGLHRPRST